MIPYWCISSRVCHDAKRGEGGPSVNVIMTHFKKIVWKHPQTPIFSTLFAISGLISVTDTV